MHIYRLDYEVRLGASRTRWFARRNGAEKCARLYARLALGTDTARLTPVALPFPLWLCAGVLVRWLNGARRLPRRPALGVRPAEVCHD